MNYNQVIKNIVAVLLLFSGGLVFAQTQDEEFQQLYQEYMELNQRLQQIQQQALQDENVAEHAEEYSAFVDEKLREIDPRAGDLVEQREETIDLIQAAQAEGDFESIQELQQGYEQISQQLQPYMQQAMADEEVQERRNEFEEILVGKMEEIDPETVPLFNRMAELSEKLDRMMQQ